MRKRLFSMERLGLLMVLITGLCAMSVYADGTEELGLPTIDIAAGTDVLIAGVGLAEAQPDSIEFTVPAGSAVQQVILYWSGYYTTEVVPGSETSSITVDGNPVTGDRIGGNTFFFTNAYVSAYREDITDLGLVAEGFNSLSVDGLDLFDKRVHGAGVLVILDDGGTLSEIGIYDGADTAYAKFPEPRETTIAKTFGFTPAALDRTADLSIITGSVAPPSVFRPSLVKVSVPGQPDQLFADMLNSADGLEWDSLVLTVDVPAAATELTVQILSEDINDTGALPASLVWIGAALSIVPEEDIDECSLKVEAESCIIAKAEPKRDCKYGDQKNGYYKGKDKDKDKGKGKGKYKGKGRGGSSPGGSYFSGYDGGPSICLSKDRFFSHHNWPNNCDKPEPEIDCADQLPAGDAGADVKFTYTVTNMGDTEVTDIIVTDNYGEVDASPIALLGAGESVELTRLIHLNEAVTNTVEVSGISGNAECVDETSIDIDQEEDPDCGCDGKVTTLTLKNNGDGAHIVVTQKKDNAKVFDGFVDSGEEFSFVGTWKKDTLGTEIVFMINGCKYVKIHTSCSQPIGPGLVAGDFEVVYGESRNAGPLCPLEPGTTQDGPDRDNDCDKDHHHGYNCNKNHDD